MWQRRETEVSRPHGRECRERIRVIVMCDDTSQQRLRTAEERLAPASPARVEFVQESRDENLMKCV